MKTIVRLIATAIYSHIILLTVPCFAETVQLSWDANPEPTLAGYKVYYQADSSTQPFSGTAAIEGVSPLDVHQQTSTTISGLDPAHTYYFAVTAYDTSGVESDYSNIVTVPETIPPSVSLTSPANNSSVTGMVSVTADASDNVSVSKVEFLVDGVLNAVVNTPPYCYVWNTYVVGNGSHTVSAKAFDAGGNASDLSMATVTVSNTSPSLNATGTGDIDGDGVVDIADALLALQIAVGNLQPSVQELQQGDLGPLSNGVATPDGKIDMTDVILILSKVVGTYAN